MLKIVSTLASRHPTVPVAFYANGGSAFLQSLSDLPAQVAVSLDWRTSMRRARQQLGPSRVLSGNVDPQVLLSGDQTSIQRHVRSCTVDSSAGGEGGGGAGYRGLVLGTGHGIDKGTPVHAVAHFVAAAREAGVEGKVEV